MDIKSKESTFLTINSAIDEYFGGDKQKFLEVALGRFVLIWINQAGTKVQVAKAGDYDVPTAEAVAQMEQITLTWYMPISSDVAARFLRKGTTGIYWGWYRPRDLAVDEDGKYVSFHKIGHLPEHDRLAWFACEGYRQPLPVDFDSAFVSRKNLKKAISDYFNVDEVAGPDPNSKWPWGSYETTLLQHLAAAAREFWGDYQTGGPAPKKEVIVAWLKGRKVSQRSADAIDTILRAENLPPGPRPNTSKRTH